MNDRELMQMALETLLRVWHVDRNSKHSMAIETLRVRLAQPEPEPVAWISHNAGLYHGKPDESLNPLPLYLAPPQREWQGLTDEEILIIYNTHTNANEWGYERAIEAKLKEKNK